MDKRYFAFISYKREDLKQAEWLRNKLSHYHFPSKLRKENEALPKAIRPLFRDSLELAGGFLAKEIETALSESKYLIVICSPRSAKSPWVNKEVEYFIEHGREEYIIPYIIDGEPFSKDPSKECFPPALRALQGEKELLGISTSELSKEAAVVKVVARMFGLRFDTLWQGYNREQKKRRIAWGAAAVFVLLLSVSVSALLYKDKNEISRQKQQIESQNKELIRKQDNLLINQSKYLASEAQKEYDKGNITKALRMALYALPRDLENPDRPYVAEAERILRTCAFPQNNNVYLRTVLKYNIGIRNAAFSSDGKIMYVETYDSVYTLDVKTGKTLQNMEREKINFSTLDNKSNGRLGFCNQHIILKNKILFLHGGYFYLCLLNDLTNLYLNKNGKLEYSLVYPNQQNYIYKDDRALYANIVGKTYSNRVGVYNGRYCNAVISPSGNRILVFDGDKAQLWDTDSNSLIKSFTTNMFHRYACFSPNEDQLVCSDSSFFVTVMDVKNGYTIKHLDHRFVCSAVYSPNGKYIATASLTKSAKVWDVTNDYSEAHTLIHGAAVNSVNFDLHNQYIVTASNDSTARVWDIQTGRPVTLPLKHNGKVTSASFSYDGNYIVTKCIVHDEKQEYIENVRVWDVNNENVVADFDINSYNKESINVYFDKSGDVILKDRISNYVKILDVKNNNLILTRLDKLPDRKLISNIPACVDNEGKYAAIGSTDNTICVWNTDLVKKIRTLRHNDGKTEQILYSPDGKYLITVSDNTMCVWDVLNDYECITNIKHESDIGNVIISPNSKTIMSIKDNVLNIWEFRNNQDLSNFSQPLLIEDSIYIFPSRNLDKIFKYKNDTLNIYESGTLKKIYSFQVNIDDDLISLSPNGKFILLKSNDNVILKDLSTGVDLKEFLNIYCGKFSPNSKFLALECRDNDSIYVYETNHWQNVAQVISSTTYFANDRFFSNSSNSALLYNDSAVIVYDVNKSKPFTVPLKNNNKYYTAKISPQDEYIAVCEDSYHIYDIKNSKYIDNKIFNELDINSVSFCPNKEGLVAISADSIVEIWDLKEQVKINRLVHEDYVDGVRFSFDGNFVATLSKERILQICDVNTGAYLSKRIVTPEDVHAMYLSHDGKNIVYVTDFGKIFIVETATCCTLLEFDLDTGHLNDYDDLSLEYDPENQCYKFIFDEIPILLVHFPPLEELIDKYRNDPEHDWSLSQEEKDEYSLE